MAGSAEICAEIDRDHVICLFDVDGTLTLPRQVLQTSFIAQVFLMLSFCLCRKYRATWKTSF